MHSHHSREYHPHRRIRYPTSLWQQLYSFIVSPALFLVCVAIVIKTLALFPNINLEHVSIAYLFKALAATFLRLVVAYVFSIVLAIPLALLANYNTFTTAVLLPIFDILESIPVLVFFPVIIVFFLHFNFFEGAAIFIIFINMLWNIVFNILGGLNSIPNDIKDASKIYGIRGLFYLRKVLLPAIFPYIVTGSLLAWAEGWNMIIVAEVIHTYIPNSTESQDLFGIGSLLVNSSSLGQNSLFIASIVLIVGAIAFLNFFIWQKLLHHSEHYKFE